MRYFKVRAAIVQANTVKGRAIGNIATPS